MQKILKAPSFKSQMQSKTGAHARIIFEIYLAQFWNLLRTQKRISIRGGIVALFLLGYFAGAFEFFLWSFRFVLSFPWIGVRLLENLWYFFFFVLWLMLIFSNAIVAYLTQYRSPEAAFLMGLPVNSGVIFCKQLLEGMFWSSWGFLFLASPFVIAFGISMKASFLYYPTAILMLGPYVFLAACLGSLITFFVLNIAKNLKTSTLYVWGGLLVGFILLTTLRFPSRLEGTEDLQILTFLKNFLEEKGYSQSIYLPTTWFSGGLVAILSGNLSQGFSLLVLLVVVSLMGASLVYSFGNTLYLKTWEKGQKIKTTYRQTVLSRLILRLRLPAMMKKDLIYFFRDPGQWIQSIVLAMIMIFYISNLKQVHNYVDHPYWENVIYFMNLTAIGLMIATFSLRFVYPQFSLEWRRSWIIGLVPIAMNRFLRIKFYFYATILFLASQVISLLSNHILESSGTKTLMASYILAFLCLGLVGLSLGLGKIYPNIKTDDPSKIMSGLGGILTLVLSMTYLAITLFPLSLPFHLLAMKSWVAAKILYIWIGGGLVFIGLFSVLLTLALFKMSLSRRCPE